MNLEFHRLSDVDAARLRPYFTLRKNRTCDSTLLDTYIWADYFHPSIAVIEDEAALLCMEHGQECFAAMPYCRESDLEQNFERLREFFNTVLQRPLKIALADEESVRYLNLENNPAYRVREETDLKDYLYCGEELRALSGKKYQKKKNLVNKFNRLYEGRWGYRTLDRSSVRMVEDFMFAWFRHRESEESLEVEKSGILYVLEHSDRLDFRMGGILIDGKLEAFSIGAENALENMAVISVEKGNPTIPGLYQVINQQFLLHEFPQVEIVNREDDMGIAGLRQAKESYHPVGYERKYMVIQNWTMG